MQPISRGTIESIADFKVTRRGDMSFIREEIPACSTVFGLCKEKNGIFHSRYYSRYYLYCRVYDINVRDIPVIVMQNEKSHLFISKCTGSRSVP